MELITGDIFLCFDTYEFFLQVIKEMLFISSSLGYTGKV